MILVLVETDASGAIEVSREAITFARDLSAAGGGVPVDAVVIGEVPGGTDALVEQLGEEHGTELFASYRDAFPPGYRADFTPPAAVLDIQRMERLDPAGDLEMTLYRPLEADIGTVRCKLISAKEISLSEVLPMFEHMGARVVDERPYEVTPRDGPTAWIYDFGLECLADDVESVRDLFREAFIGVWRDELEDDIERAAHRTDR